MRASRGLKWENKMYKLERSITRWFFWGQPKHCFYWVDAVAPDNDHFPVFSSEFWEIEGISSILRMIRFKVCSGYWDDWVVQKSLRLVLLARPGIAHLGWFLLQRVIRPKFPIAIASLWAELTSNDWIFTTIWLHYVCVKCGITKFSFKEFIKVSEVSHRLIYFKGRIWLTLLHSAVAVPA